MSTEKERLLDHEYDGIQEFDNPTPRWWTWIFWASVAFALLYWWNPGHMISGRGRIADYQLAMADAERRWPKPPSGAEDAIALAALVRDPSALAMGKATFATNCVVCHRADGGGVIGPNLTDEYWLHGGTLPEIYKTIYDGVLEKGMPAWGKVFKPADVNALAAFVSTLRGSNPANARAPEGTKISP